MNSKRVACFPDLSDKIRALVAHSSKETRSALLFCGAEQVEAFDLVTQKKVGTSKPKFGESKETSSIYSLAYLPSAELLLAGRHNGNIDFVDKNFNVINSIQAHKDVVRFVTIHEGSIFSGSYDGTVKVFDVKKLQNISQGCAPALASHQHKGYVNSIIIEPCAAAASSSSSSTTTSSTSAPYAAIYSASSDGITQYDVQSNSLSLTSTADEILFMQAKPQSEPFSVFAASKDSSIQVFEKQKPEKPMKSVHTMFPSHKAAVTNVQATTSHLYSASADKTVKVWDVNYYFEIGTVETKHKEPIRSQGVIQNNEQQALVITGGQDKSVEIWKCNFTG